MLVTQTSKFSHKLLLGLAIFCWVLLASFFLADYLFNHDIRASSLPSDKPTPDVIGFVILFVILISLCSILSVFLFIFSLPRPWAKGFSIVSLSSAILSGLYVSMGIGIILFLLLS